MQPLDVLFHLVRAHKRFLLQLQQFYPTHQRGERCAQLVRGFLGHASPYLVLFRTAGVAEEQVGHQQEQSKYNKLNYRIIARLLHQISGAVEDGGFALVHELDLERLVLVAHDFQLSRHITAVFHHQRVEIAETEDLRLVFVGDDDGYAHRVEGDFLHEVVNHAFQNGLQLRVIQRLVVIQPLHDAVSGFNFNGRKLGIGHFHLGIKGLFPFLLGRKVVGR